MRSPVSNGHPVWALAVLLAMALAGYMAFFVYSQYRAQEELRKASLTRFLYENEKHALSIDYFLSDRINDLIGMTEDRELFHYYENLALGMSREYGLDASLAIAEERFRKTRGRLKFGNLPIYSRLAYVDAGGEKLIDDHDPGKFLADHRRWRNYLLPKGRHPVFLSETTGGVRYVIISCPYGFKGRYAGQLLAWIPLETVYGHFETSSKDPLLINAFVLYDEYLHIPRNEARIPSDYRLPEPRTLKPNTPFSISVVGADNQAHIVAGMLTPVGRTPFALAAFIPEEPKGGGRSSGRILAIMAGFGILIFTGGISLIRTVTRNAVLKARLEETGVRERIVEEKNANLRNLRTAVDQSANAIVITSLDEAIVYVNPFFTTLTGYTSEEVHGKNFVDRWSLYNDPEITREIRSVIARGERWSGELVNKRKTGEIIWEQVTIAPVKNERGETTNYISIKEDITQRKKAEEETLRMNVDLEQRVQERTAALERSTRELEGTYAELKIAESRLLQQEKMASIGLLAAGVAHEINNPMGFISSNLGSLRKYADRLTRFIDAQNAALPETGLGMETVRKARTELKVDRIREDIRKLLDQSLDGAERVKKIVQDLKSFSRVDQAELAQANINEGLDSTINIVWNEIKYKATVVKEYGEIPPATCNIGQLNQVFLNLLVNAAHSIENRGEIRVKTSRDGDHILVAISDTGCGIPVEHLSRIFEPFFTTKEVGKGTGLGLSFAYDIVKKHNGNLDVESAPGKGSTFTVSIPVNESSRSVTAV